MGFDHDHESIASILLWKIRKIPRGDVNGNTLNHTRQDIQRQLLGELWT